MSVMVNFKKIRREPSFDPPPQSELRTEPRASASASELTHKKWLIQPLVAAIIIVGVATVILYMKYGTIEPCGMLRAQLGQDSLRQDGFMGSLSATLPDAAINLYIQTRYGQVTPGTCISALIEPKPNRK